MKYYARYTILICGSTWGVEDYEFEAEDDVEAVQKAFDYEEDYVEIRNGRAKNYYSIISLTRMGMKLMPIKLKKI